MMRTRHGRTYTLDLASLQHRFVEYGLVFEGALKIDQGGEYRFFLSSDDGSKLYLDGAELVNNDGLHGVLEKTGTTRLSPGKHSLKIQYFQQGGGASLGLEYEGPGIPRQTIPADLLLVD